VEVKIHTLQTYILCKCEYFSFSRIKTLYFDADVIGFNPEDGDSTLLRNVGFYQPVHPTL
jgi:hypothetical protein